MDFVDLLNGWAVGVAGTIVHTADAGASWTLQASGTTEALNSVDFVDPWNGWAVGGTESDWPSLGTRIILHTGDGGLTWQTQLTASDYPLTDVEFADSLSGWAVGTGSILHTVDGGATWSQQYSGFAARSLSFVSASVGWAAGERGGLLHTTDGGATWETQRIPLHGDPGFAERIHDIDFVNETTGWAAGGSYVFSTGSNSGRLFQTTDSGATWQRRSYLDSRGPLKVGLPPRRGPRLGRRRLRLRPAHQRRRQHLARRRDGSRAAPELGVLRQRDRRLGRRQRAARSSTP